MKSLPKVSLDTINTFNHSVSRDLESYINQATEELVLSNPQLLEQMDILCNDVFIDSKIIKNMILKADKPRLADVALEEVYQKAMVITMCILGMLNSQIEADEIKDLFE